VNHVEVYRGTDDNWYWRVVSSNHQVIAAGAESFTRRWSAKRAARNANPDTTITVVK
jgi:uncharacterized protein YegP (UPF0339 family)